MKQILLVGAFDRFNYGDLLFPQVTRRALEHLGVETDFAGYATVARDLRAEGGVACRALGELATAPPPAGSVLLVTGGDVLAARWTDTARHLTTPGRSLGLKLVEKTLGAEVSDRLARRALGTKLALPWVFSPEELTGPEHPLRLVYSGVGGSGLGRVHGRHRRRLEERLARAADLSVRDRDAQEVLTAWGLAPRLVPDPASLMAWCFPLENLRQRPLLERVRQRFPQGYLVCQLGRFPAAGHAALIARQLESLTRETGLGVVLLPLGRAAGHEDAVPLVAVRRHLGGDAFGPGEAGDATVFDLMAVIAHAGLFAGTSLHGNLTAMAFEVPRVGLGPRDKPVKKLDAFLRTWDAAQPAGSASFEDLAERGLAALAQDPDLRRRVRRDLETASWDHFGRLAQLIAATGVR